MRARDDNMLLWLHRDAEQGIVCHFLLLCSAPECDKHSRSNRTVLSVETSVNVWRFNLVISWVRKGFSCQCKVFHQGIWYKEELHKWQMWQGVRHSRGSIKKLFSTQTWSFSASFKSVAVTGVPTTLGLDLNIDLHPNDLPPTLPLSVSHGHRHSFTLAHRSATDRPARHPLCSPCISVTHKQTHTFSLSRSETLKHTQSYTHC